MICKREEEYTDALKNFNKSLKLNPNQANIYNEIGEILTCL